MKQYGVALDVGGTFLRSGLIASDGSAIESSFRTVPIDVRSADTIIGTLVQSIRSAFDMAASLRLDVAGIGVGIGGPFHREKGISYMKHKLRPIYGLDLRKELIKRLKIERDFLIRFEVDSWAFLMGEAWLGAARGFSRVIGVTIGTGLGSCFMADGRIVVNRPGVPRFGGWIGCLPRNGGILEDRVSASGIIARYKELAGKGTHHLDAKEIASLGLEQADEAALQVFREVGSVLGKALHPFAFEFEAECIVFGGQISRSFCLFAESFKRELRSVSSLKRIAAGGSIDFSALYGVTRVLFSPESPDTAKQDEESIKGLEVLRE